jgi:lactate dehydrogenase-like 2-hydroxyacid dehydrogenase
VAKIEILSAGYLPQETQEALGQLFGVHRIGDGVTLESLGSKLPAIRGVARGGGFAAPRAVLGRLPNAEIFANFGVGYDGVDLVYARERGIIVTNTPDVLTEEVADTALGLLLMTVRELSAAERYLREGSWSKGNYRLTPGTMRDRTVGIVGLGRIGLAIARRLDAMQVPIAYHSRKRRTDVAYAYHDAISELAAAVDTLIVVLPGGESTHNIVDADVLKALGPRGVLINVGRGSSVDEPALIEALRGGTILAAGLDVFADEPRVPAELLALPNAVVLPHVGSASSFTRMAMGQLLIDNLTGWFEQGKPVTPVPETPWPRAPAGKEVSRAAS